MTPPRDVDLLIHGCDEIATALGDRPRGGKELGAIQVWRQAAIACDAGRIVEVGPTVELEQRYRARERVAARGGTLIPGLVDCHTHPVFAGTREDEFERRVAGATYEEIARAGGGIAASLRGVRGASRAELVAGLLVRLDRFLELGTTTVEAKTGYGLTLADELKSLEAIAEADREHPVDLVATCLAAHAYPPEYRERHADYERLVVDQILPAVARQGIARYADVFTERIAFDLDASRRILGAAAGLGLGLRLHVDQLTPLGGAELAAELGASSADHLEHVSDAGIAALGAAGVVPVLCPLVPLYLRERAEAPARRMVDAGLAPALSTDFNPGSCYLQSLFEVLSWSALRYGFSAAEALTAATLNAACSLDLGHDRGTLEPGKRADLVLTDLPNHHHLTYELGRAPVRLVVKDGRVAHRREA